MPHKMKEPFSADFLRSVLHYDPETGVFTWLHRPDHPRKWNSRYAGTRAGSFSHGYRAIQVQGRAGFRASRLAWLYMTGEWPKVQVDHEDLDRSNDVWSNLRLATNAQNSQNKRAQSNNTHGNRGITRHGVNGWRARITAFGTVHELGYYDKLEQAIAARAEAEKRLHGEFAPTAPSGS